MATSRPISTISYNTEGFLRVVCDKLVKQHTIQYYMYIKHIGEEGDKDHIHLYMQPNTRIDPMDIKDLFDEPVAWCNIPLKCRDFRPSVEEHWIMYCLHDPDYLKAHERDEGSQDGKIPYQDCDIKSSYQYYPVNEKDPDCKELRCPDMEYAIRRARASQRKESRSISLELKKGAKPSDLIETGSNPVQVNSVAHSLHLDNSAYLMGRIYKMNHVIHSLTELLKNEYHFTFEYGEFDIHQETPYSAITPEGEVILLQKDEKD